MHSLDDVDFNYILNDLALLNLCTKCLYSESATDRDRRTLYSQVSMLIKEKSNLKKENASLKQWDVNKDTRNSRQRIANKQLHKKNKEYKDRVEYLESILKKEGKI